MDPSRVLWIGGPQGSGTSALARALAQRFDLQLYSLDERAASHEPRLPGRDPRSRTFDEQPVDAAPAQLLGSFLTASRHRFRLVLEDLRALPDTPLALVEGRELFPTSVSAVLGAPEQALFLLPDPARHRESPSAARYSQEARDLRFTVLSAELPLGDLVELAAAQFLPAISAAGDRSP